MSDPNQPLGVVVTNTLARRIIYGTYVVGAVVVGGVAAYFFGIGSPLPEQLIGAQAVVAYLAIPVGSLALANVR